MNTPENPRLVFIPSDHCISDGLYEGKVREHLERQAMSDPFDIHREMSDEELSQHINGLLEKVGKAFPLDATVGGEFVYDAGTGVMTHTKMDEPVLLTGTGEIIKPSES